MDEEFKILLAGDGGQGVQVIAKVICEAVLQSGKNVTHISNYGLEQRGGVSLAFIKIAKGEISYAKFSRPDILAVLSAQSMIRTAQYQKPGVKIVDLQDTTKLNLPAEAAKNIFLLAVLAKILEEKKLVLEKDVKDLFEKIMKKKHGWENNLQAYQIGLENYKQRI